jgi:predicted DNA-binding transcriptional regulator AlpA
MMQSRTLLTRAHLLDKYGPRLTMEQVSEVLGLARQTVWNQLSDGSLPIRTYREAGRRWASFEAVADYLEERDASATVEKKPGIPSRVE